MNFRNRFLLAGLCLLLAAEARTQDKNQEKLPVKFGKVTPEDFNVNTAGLDTAAGAVVIADYGTSTFDGNAKGWFDLVFKHSRRVKILKQTAFDIATVTISLYVGDRDQEKLEGLKASTYTLENGKVVETRLDDKSVFTDKLDKHHIVKKFTFPALKEGAIVEYTYTQTSPYLFDLQPWSFQGAYPRLWSEYQVDIPDFFRYVTMGYGYVPFYINSSKGMNQTFHLTFPGGADKDDHETMDDNVVTHRWVMKNVPALQEEAFTTSMENYLARIEFQQSGYSFPGQPGKDIMGTWFSVSEGLLKDDDFGADLDNNNGWLDADLQNVTRGSASQLEKAQKIYAFVRDNFNCTGHNSMYLADPLKTIFKNRHGSEADLNLLLTAMLRHEKINADPVILSTRDNGFANPIYPLLSRFNYVVAKVNIDSKDLYLDASEPWLAFGKLPNRCYNGYARVLNKEMPSETLLMADSLRENKNTLVMISNAEKGGLLGHLTSIPGFNEACELREKVKASGQDEFFKTIQTAYTGEYKVSSPEMDSLHRPDDPLTLAYDLKITPDTSSDIFYFNPMLSEGYKTNPFKSAERKYPVEMPFAMDEIYTLNMEIPEGYVVDEMPKAAKVLFNDDEGSFEYLLQKSDALIQFRSRIRLNKANFKPEDYATLRDFFALIVKKQSEQIVFKKKKSA
jgi:Domain of Unknown Function with PDB structure (DUF3858)/Domain of Unknown Function with PDB structure (DUF3857)/Transglutaminase-like superfamily